MERKQTQSDTKGRIFLKTEVSRDTRRAVERAAKSQDTSVSRWLRRVITEKLAAAQSTQE